VGGQPSARQHDRRPPRVPGEDQRGRHTADHFYHAAGDEIQGDSQGRAGHAEVEIARDGEVAGERRILEVPHAGRAHAGFGEPVVEPGRGAVAKVGANRLMNRAQHLKQHEDGAGEGQRTGEGLATLHGGDEHAHGDGEGRREGASEQEGRPPGGGKAGVRFRQDGEELPFLALGEPLEHTVFWHRTVWRGLCPARDQARPQT